MFACLFLILGVDTAVAQELELPILSPRATVSQEVGTVLVSVDYSSPGKRGREVFGALVPFDELWRTGANQATNLTLSGDATIGGKAVPEGTYSVFTIPGADSWTVVLNNDATASTSRYEENQDQVRFQVKPMTGEDRERLTFVFRDTNMESSVLDIEWAGVRVPLSIEIDSKGRGDTAIELYVSRAARSLSDAARFKASNGDVDAGLALVDKALGIDETWFIMWAKAELLHDKGANRDAYKMATATLAKGSSGDNFFWQDRVEKALAEWPKK